MVASGIRKVAHLLDAEIGALRTLAAACVDGTYRHDYRERIAVERAIFNTAKHIARTAFALELTGFSPAAREAVEERVRAQPELREAANGLRVGFELAAVGAALCSGSAYIRKDISIGLIDGRANALKIYGYRLTRYADLVEEFSSETYS